SRELVAMLADGCLEVVTADLFFELPQKRDIDRCARFARRDGAEQRRQRGTLVVGSTATNVSVALDGELERVGAPVVAVGGLDVEVVVNGDGRPARRLGEPRVDQRMATGFDQFCPRTKSLEQCLSGIGAAPYVGCPGGIDGD